MADFYFTDRKYNQLGIASTDELASSSVIAIDDIGGQEGDYQSVEGGYRSYSATLHFSPDQSAQVKEMAKVGNFVLFKGRAGESVWTTILSSEHDPLAGTNTFVAEDASIDLINGTVGAYAASSAMTIAQYIELFAGNSGFVIGYNEIPDLTRTLKWDSDDSSILTRILSVAKQFGVELSFRFEVRGLSVIGKYIDIRKHIGGNKGIYLRVDTDLNKIVTTSDIADLCTAIAGTGGTPEGSNDPITLKGYRWTDPNGRYVLGGDGVLRDPVALRTWSRLLSNTNTNPVDAHITRNKTYEATTQATLLQSVLSDLEKFNHPAINYEVDIAKLPDTVNIGDTVYLVDEDEQLFLSARVLELTYSYSNESGTATLGDYLIQASQVDPAYRELADQIKNIPKTVQYYPWIRYADDDKGTNMSAFPANKKYMAIVPNAKSSVPSDNPDDYAGKWALIQGKDGADGKPGPAGTSSYLHTAYANSIDGSQDFSTTDGNGKSYFGQYVDQTQADSTDPTKYSWALFKGTDGRDGKDGSDNVPVITVGAAYPSGPKKGDMHWLTDSSGVVTGYYTYDGSAWNPYKIDAKILSAETFNGMTFNGVTFTGSKFISSFKGIKPDGTADFSVHGTTTIADGSIVTDTYSDTDNTHITHVVMDQFGFLSNIYNKGTLMASTQMSLGMLTLGSSYQDYANTKPYWVTSSLDALAITRLNNVGALLWQGVNLLGWSGADQEVTPSKPISDCLNGWLLVWSEYKNGVAQDYDYIVTPIYRSYVQAHSGKQVTLQMVAYGAASFNKKVFPTNQKIVGDRNNSGGAGNPSVAGNYVLVNVFTF
ncbi:phage tail spike protein [Lacticaseibacillus paracasei]|uniref:phage tail spike protein n=1 Tax=Lacticaseibacillus paracasei TaxID=1597 RepID=UPI0025A044CC|nr:phage tail spike protein [Lacticaseibacillus paracasei]MDM7529971.1 phage tail spike protein [Lacticaseibacillus paracasei]MDM7542103.1 phage tail spike protein [Lacticaseibacillus paracasei]